MKSVQPPDGVEISTNKSNLDVEYIHEYLANHSYWAEGIPLETVRKSIEGSLCFGVYAEGRQIGFARVISDQATFAYLADVFIDAQFRGRGLASQLLTTIMADPRLEGMRNWMLGTKDAHQLYAKFGFKPLEDPQRIMRINVPDIYLRH